MHLIRFPCLSFRLTTEKLVFCSQAVKFPITDDAGGDTARKVHTAGSGDLVLRTRPIT